MALVGSLALIVAHGPGIRPAQRRAVALLAAMVLALIVFSRLVLNVHYPTDIASGLAVGGFWLVVGGLSRAREPLSAP